MKSASVIIFIVLSLLAIGIYFSAHNWRDISSFLSTKINVMTISSPTFENNRFIPSVYTCDGDNVNPPFKILETPQNAKSLVLIVDDPDAPSGAWVHWLLWNIDPATKEIAQNSVPSGAVEGTTSFGETGYGGPCPPSGTHRYFFKLYALDAILKLNQSAAKSELEKAMNGHILAEAQLVGLYGRVK